MGRTGPRPVHPMDRVESQILLGSETDCWLWAGRLNNNGYAQFNDGSKVRSVHRFTYEFFVHAVSSGLDLDHLCRNRSCVNPWHLDPVTRQANLRRGARPGPKPWASQERKREQARIRQARCRARKMNCEV